MKQSISEKIKIALTTGCPQGVGPEISVSAASKLSDNYDILIYGDKQLLKEAAEKRVIKKELNIKEIELDRKSEHLLSPERCGNYSFRLLEEATEDIIQNRRDALVTSPINKYHWKKAGINTVGHTEYLAKKTNVANYAMMMACPALKVVLVTIHAPLREALKNITTDKIIEIIETTLKALKEYFGLTNPKIAVTGINPHAGDSGTIGKEEETIINPAINIMKNRRYNVSGPYPADSVFYRASKGEFDAVIAMYHDQGLIACKTLDFKNSVNITLGIPIIRTSVDHGTADDIAGKKAADDTNLIEAIKMAAKIYNTKSK